MEENKKQRIYKIIMLVFVTCLITCLVTSIVVYNYAINSDDQIAKNKKTEKEASTLTEEIERYRKIIDEYYLGEIDEEKLKQGAIKGYISALGDEYTEYYTKEEMKELMEDTNGNYIGIGIYMVKDTEKDAVKVLTPIEGTPAEKAGIQPNDIISKVDGIEYKAEQMTEAANHIKGQEGTTVKLEIIRGTEILNFEIKRENIKLNYVEGKVLQNNVGYLQLSTFDEKCSEEFKQKYDEINKDNNLKGLIIDLRNNGGGLVDEAEKIADYFLDKDATILITKDKKEKEEIRKAKKDKEINLPVVILINGNTASASEILTGALRDNGVAKVVGTKSYGKGVIQDVLSLTDGSGLKVTTNEYYTPNRIKIHKVGIEPDEKVELPDNIENELQVNEKDDTQLKKAIEMLK